MSRRRFIGISAAAAGMALLPLPLRGRAMAEPLPELHVWRGVALGADCVLQIHHPSPAVADRLIARSIDEIRRLERVFSLYREDSAISVLNRAGSLADPPIDLVRLLAESERYNRLTDGAFDATVQPLWQLYAGHFGEPDADPTGPSPEARAAALAVVGHDKIGVDADTIRLNPGTQVTLNGIAQGYITDRVAEMLLGAGIERALVNIDETRALGDSPSGEPWQVGIEDPVSPERIAETLAIRNLAIGTSGGYGTQFDPAGRFNHIFDPKTGLTSYRYLSVTVVAPLAMTADALSTAFSLMPLDRTQVVVTQLGITAHFAMPDGSRLVQSA
jgi:thiamine biosynthesis lipoprotein